jgi:DNA-binding transcriptional MocR family regulator
MTRAEALAADIRRQIETGSLRPGAKLPSIRRAADRFAALALPLLRERLAFELGRNDIQASLEHILLTFGANHALDLIVRRFLNPGDIVLVDDPGYYPLFAKLKLAQVTAIGVRRLPIGPDVEDLASKVENHNPKLFFTQSLAHNPTGSSTNVATAHSLLKIAAQHDMLVVEDDPFVDLPTVTGLGLGSLDQLEHVICVRTFAKTLSASLRCGFIAARPDIIASLAELKMLTTVNSSGHVEHLVHGIITDGHYRRHLKRLGDRITQASNTVCSLMQQKGYKLFAEPTGGYYIYLELPHDIQLARDAARESIFIAPGSLFSVSKDRRTAGIRVNVSRASDPRFYDFLARATR